MGIGPDHPDTPFRNVANLVLVLRGEVESEAVVVHDSLAGAFGCFQRVLLADVEAALEGLGRFPLRLGRLTQSGPRREPRG